MAERNVVCYSFYVPEQDEQLRAFLAAQSNLSLSMRLLVKAFIANGASSGQDISVADLGVLVRSMTAENVADGAEPPKRGRRRVADGAGTARIARQQAAEPAPAMQAAAAAVSAAANPAPAPVSGDDSRGEEPKAPGEPAKDAAGTDGVPAGKTDAPGLPDAGTGGTVPSAAAGSTDDLPDDSFPQVDEDGSDEEDYEPQVTPESGTSHDDARGAYNGAMNKGIPVMDPDEDIEALMGDVG